MTDQPSQVGSKPEDEFRMYASPVGAHILKEANEIIEDFPVRKYVLFFILFLIEVIVVFGFAFYLIH
jgi:hypothetical protein